MNQPIAKSPTKVFQSVFDCIESGIPILIHSGGTNSGKTYSIVQALLTLACYQNWVISVTGQDRPNLIVGPYRDAQDIISQDPFIKSMIVNWNKSRMEFEFSSGAIVEFDSRSDQQDAKQGKRKILFGNEANGLPFVVYEEMRMRTSVLSIMDFNPTARFWAHDKYEARDDVMWVNTTYKDNPFIDQSVLETILSYEPTPENIARGTANEYRWKVYGLGEVGRLEGLVFPDFKVSSEWPDEYKWRVFGMDFGYTNDPTTLIEIRYAHGNLYWKQHIYQTGLTNPEIAKEVKRLEFNREKIVADSAEPKSIEEIKRNGCYIIPAEKGRDSINQGIDAIKRYKCYIHSTSKDLIEEFSSYTWDKDRDGNPTNKPVDKFNHGIDAGRYALSKKILKPQLGYS